MCGIAGYSLNPESTVKRTLAAQALLAGIAERGADAVGYAHRGSATSVTVHKRRSGATALLDEVHVPGASTRWSSGARSSRSESVPSRLDSPSPCAPVNSEWWANAGGVPPIACMI